MEVQGVRQRLIPSSKKYQGKKISLFTSEQMRSILEV
jgi:hypothetical protein